MMNISPNVQAYTYTKTLKQNKLYSRATDIYKNDAARQCLS